MTDAQSKILESLHTGPKSLRDLWASHKATISLKDVLDALWALQDGKQAMFMPAVGMYKLR